MEVPICQSRCLNLTASGRVFRCGSVTTEIRLSPCKTTGGTCERIFVVARKFGSSKVGAIPAWMRRLRAPNFDNRVEADFQSEHVFNQPKLGHPPVAHFPLASSWQVHR